MLGGCTSLTSQRVAHTSPRTMLGRYAGTSAYQRTIGGSSATTYDVKLRVRGLTEPNTYADGMLNSPRFYVGGHTTQTGYTAYSLTVSDPPQVYFFNYNASVGHFVFELDYEVVIPMRGGTTEDRKSVV